MKTLAILIDKLGYSQKAKRVCETLNQMQEYNPVLFVAEYGPSLIKTNFPIMEMVKAYDYKATFIATDFYTNQVMNNCLFATKKYFYVWDFEYLYIPHTFGTLNQFYNNPSVGLIARNQYRFDILKNTWKEPVGILNDFQKDQLEALL